MRLIEPLGFLHGAEADEAVLLGLAVPLAGGPFAFTLVRLQSARLEPAPMSRSAQADHDRVGGSLLVRVGDVPPDWRDALARLSAPVPAWAGLDPLRPAVMGILNVTPDSFSDGGQHTDADAAVAVGLTLAAQGADIIDVGGESARPGAAPVRPDVEQARILPVIRALAATGIRISIDTRHAATMAAALDAGAAIVNDISGLSHDPDAAALVASRGCPVVLMHMRGDPATMGRYARYDDVTLDVVNELSARVAAAESAGVAPDRIAIDPGIGFAKTAEHNLELLARLPVLLNIGRRLLIGISRKAFVGRLSGASEPRERDAGSLSLGLQAVARGASVLRVHDVAGTVQAVRVRGARLGHWTTADTRR